MTWEQEAPSIASHLHTTFTLAALPLVFDLDPIASTPQKYKINGLDGFKIQDLNHHGIALFISVVSLA